MAKKTFILDTNVLIHDPDAFTAFGDNFVVLPMAVIEELDNLKKLHDERGRAARNVSRKLNQLAEKGKFNEGITLENGGILITCSCSYHIDKETFRDMLIQAASDSEKDFRIIEFRGQAPDHPVSLSMRETEYLKCAVLKMG